uniref:Uncharacterized protein n=1 Tax=Salix viminalis TaxID=40686 RepID=A0A6N2LXB3_SALVM
MVLSVYPPMFFVYDVCFSRSRHTRPSGSRRSCEEDEAEQAHPSLDPHEDRQHHQVQCEAQALAPYQARVLSWRIDLKFELSKCFLVFNLLDLKYYYSDVI